MVGDRAINDQQRRLGRVMFMAAHSLKAFQMIAVNRSMGLNRLDTVCGIVGVEIRSRQRCFGTDGK